MDLQLQVQSDAEKSSHIQHVRKTFRRILQDKSDKSDKGVEAKMKTTTVQEDGTHEDTLMQDLAPAEANAAQGDRHARLSL